MEKYFSVLKKSPLFSGISAEELEQVLGCMNAVPRKFRRGQNIFTAGGEASRIGIVLAGGVQVVRDDVFGNRAILAALGEADMFGETFACAGVNTLPVSVIAAADSTILLADYRKIINTCPSSCAFHNRMIENMLKILAVKNLALNQKIEALSARTTREKLLVYLTAQANKNKNRKFTIPLDRQQLADYLSVDRSAMSAELGRMRDDGIVAFHKNMFELL